MNHLDVVGTEAGKVGLETLSPQGLPRAETGRVYRMILDNSVSRMLKSIQDNLGFSAAEDAILKWLEGCSIDGVERLSIALNDYLQNRREAESTDEQET